MRAKRGGGAGVNKGKERKGEGTGEKREMGEKKGVKWGKGGKTK